MEELPGGLVVEVGAKKDAEAGGVIGLVIEGVLVGREVGGFDRVGRRGILTDLFKLLVFSGWRVRGRGAESICGQQ